MPKYGLSHHLAENRNCSPTFLQPHAETMMGNGSYSTQGLGKGFITNRPDHNNVVVFPLPTSFVSERRPRRTNSRQPGQWQSFLQPAALEIFVVVVWLKQLKPFATEVCLIKRRRTQHEWGRAHKWLRARMVGTQNKKQGNRLKGPPERSSGALRFKLQVKWD